MHAPPRLFIETVLSDGTPICLRTIRPSDENRIKEGILQMSDRSRYLRFFSAFREPPPAVVKQLSAVDGHDHIAWGAVRTDLDKPLPIGAAHAIRVAGSKDRGELSVALLDEYHGLGLARTLLAAVLLDCEREDMDALEMHLMSENQSAARLIVSLGARRVHAIDSVEHYELRVSEAIAALRGPGQPRGVKDVLDADSTAAKATVHHRL